ncbi:MAG: TIGR00730 family Rossman fold protein [Gammaproteobacteria bacterium]|nr:TIGR00730 family Rossman fold protein [Gammaproteobacteria bacterium]
MQAISVYCGSSPGLKPDYAASARLLGSELAARGITLVYGGGRVGLMGTIADEVLAAGGRVVGVIPTDIAEREVQHESLTELHIVASMHERKMLMTKLSDGMIAMPGGLGTIEELFEVWTWAQLGFHSKPCALLNVDGYYDQLLAFLDAMVSQRFVKRIHRDLLHTDTDPAALLEWMQAYVPVTADKWLDMEKT